MSDDANAWPNALRSLAFLSGKSRAMPPRRRWSIGRSGSRGNASENLAQTCTKIHLFGLVCMVLRLHLVGSRRMAKYWAMERHWSHLRDRRWPSEAASIRRQSAAQVQTPNRH